MAEIIQFEVDARSIPKVLADLNSQFDKLGQTAEGVPERLQKSWERASNILIKTFDRQLNSMNSLTRSIEKQAAAYGQTPIDKLIAQRDQHIKRLGDEQNLIERVTKAYQKMIDVESKRQGTKGDPNVNLGGIFSQATSAIGGSNPISNLAVQIGSAVGPIGVAAGSITAAIATIGVAGYKAAESLASFGVEIHATELKMGVTAKEAQALAFAAKAVGTDMGAVERTIRGLTVAIEDTGASGEKSRAILQGFGVDIEGVKNGAVPTKDLLVQVSQGLNSMKSDWERNAAALQLFRRAGIDLIPFMVDLSKNLGTAEGLTKQFATEEDVNRFNNYKRQVAEIDTAWDSLTRRLKDPLAGIVLVSLKWATDALTDDMPAVFNKKLIEGDGWVAKARRFMMGERYIKTNALDVDQPRLDASQKYNADSLRKGAASAIQTPTAIENDIANNGGLEAQEKKLEKFKKDYDETLAGAKDKYLNLMTKAGGGKSQVDAEKQVNTELLTARDHLEEQKNLVESMRRSESDRVSNLRELTKLQDEAKFDKEHPFGETKVQRQQREFQSRSGMTPALIDQANATVFQPALNKELQDMIKDAVAKQRELAQRISDKVDDENSIKGEKEARSKGNDFFLKQLEEQRKQLEPALKLDTQAYKFGVESNFEQASGQIKSAEITDPRRDARYRAEIELADLRKRFADDQLRHDLELAQEEHRYDGNLDEARQEARLKYAKDLSKIEMDLAANAAEEYRRQFDLIKSQAETVWSTLFNKPKDFGKVLGNTIKEAAIHPVVESLSNSTAQILQPFIFHTKTNSPIVSSTDSNTRATQENTAALRNFTGALSGSSDRTNDLLGRHLDLAGDGADSTFESGNRTNDLLSRILTAVKPAAANSMPSGVTSSTISYGDVVSNVSKISELVSSPSGSPIIPGTSISPSQFQRVSANLSKAVSATTAGSGASFGAASFLRGNSFSDAGIPPLLRSSGQSYNSSSPWFDNLGGTTTPLVSSSISYGIPGDLDGGAPNIPYSWPGLEETGLSVIPGIGAMNELASQDYSGPVSAFNSPMLREASGRNPYTGLIRGVGGTFAKFFGGGGQGQGAGSDSSGSSRSPFPGGFSASSFKNINWGGFTHKDTGTAGPDENTPGTDDGSGAGGITGVSGLAGQGLTAGGMYLAQRGLLGQDRGTGKGIAEGTAGGAAVGFATAGPIGAAVGAVVGFSIGVGEKLAGVESPMNEAKRLVKSRYHITIDNQTANQIVAIAQQKYANHVSIAVMSPEVRQMLGLYAAGTGQNIAASASTPHGGSLVEQGGTLYQGATYQYGKAYLYNSNLPVAGGVTGQQLSSPTAAGSSNAPVSLTLNVDGKGAGDFLAGNVVTPDFVQSQWSSAQQGSNGRLDNTALFSQPGLITS